MTNHEQEPVINTRRGSPAAMVPCVLALAGRSERAKQV